MSLEMSLIFKSTNSILISLVYGQLSLNCKRIAISAFMERKWKQVKI